MFRYNNSHIFTGYLKQLLSSFNLPTSKVYTDEFANYLAKHGKEDPRVLESFDTISKDRAGVTINYLKNDSLQNYFSPSEDDLIQGKALWRRCANTYYDSEKRMPNKTRNLHSPSRIYDSTTHEYLGDYLRFIRDYHNINLMSLYNCFTDKIYNNISFSFIINPNNSANKVRATFDSYDTRFRIYALPVKLFADYTIAVDSNQGIEIFCGLYNSNIDISSKSEKLAVKTYQKFNKTLFGQPVLYNKLNVDNWSADGDFTIKDSKKVVRTDAYTRWDLVSREKDLKMFIKVPVSCKSTITILEGDYRSFNDSIFAPANGKLVYKNNHTILNFNTDKHGDNIDLNTYKFKPISKLQLLAINTGESYPFANRLVEYLSGSAITPIDEIPDNIRRIQKVMNNNNYYFSIDGAWENKIQNIIYDYVMNSGPIKVVSVDTTTPKSPDKKETITKLKDFRKGYHHRQGHISKSTMYDILGYVDKDAEKLYSSWKNDNGVAKIGENLQTVNIYGKLYDI